MLPTPQIGHLTSEDYEHVYEPAEDSFIFLDALEEDAAELVQLRPDVCVEIGYEGFATKLTAQTWLGDRLSLSQQNSARHFVV